MYYFLKFIHGMAYTEQDHGVAIVHIGIDMNYNALFENLSNSCPLSLEIEHLPFQTVNTNCIKQKNRLGRFTHNSFGRQLCSSKIG